MSYLYYECCQNGKHGQQCHASKPSQVDRFEQEEACPAQLLGGVWWVAHVVGALHVELLDEAAAQVTELVKAVLAVVSSHAAVTCVGGGGEGIRIGSWSCKGAMVLESWSTNR